MHSKSPQRTPLQDAERRALVQLILDVGVKPARERVRLGRMAFARAIAGLELYPQHRALVAAALRDGAAGERPAKSETRDLINTMRAAWILRGHPGTVDRLVCDGYLKPVYWNGRRMFRRSQVEGVAAGEPFVPSDQK